MKRTLSVIWILLLLLTGCSVGEALSAQGIAEEEKTPVEQETAIPEASAAPEISAPGAGLFLEMEHTVYDPSVERYTYFLRNDTEQEVDFGAAYTIQQLVNGTWQDLEPEGEIAWIAVAYILQPGDTMALTCGFDLYEEEPVPGTYRLVKKAGSQTLYAEFEIGESIYTAETPYGFAPLEMLPQDYSAATASENDVVFTGDGVKNMEAVETFLFKSGLGAACQLRTVQDYGENTPMVIDVIHENDHFLWRMWNQDHVVEKRFSYIVTDGAGLYLSNGADWEYTQKYNSDKTLLIPEGAEFLLVGTEAQMEGRLYSNITRYKVWSADGVWCARLPESNPAEPVWGTPTEFSVSWQKPGEGSRGSSYDLQNWDGLETAITALEWQEDGRLLLTCDTLEGQTSYLCFDPQTERLTN